MLILSNTDVWLLHSIVSMFLWGTFIGLILLALGCVACAIDKAMDMIKESKEDQNNDDK